ncbi:hypothetical protein LSAT2_003483, partial [Lamellibrachia satsuma]
IFGSLVFLAYVTGLLTVAAGRLTIGMTCGGLSRSIASIFNVFRLVLLNIDHAASKCVHDDRQATLVFHDVLAVCIVLLWQPFIMLSVISAFLEKRNDEDLHEEKEGRTTVYDLAAGSAMSDAPSRDVTPRGGPSRDSLPRYGPP